MQIGGFLKMTLTDYPGYIAAVVFTQGCNFRCTYCHNSELIPNALGSIDEGEVIDYIKGKKYFLDGVVITGGEPTIQNDLVQFIKKIKKMGLLVKLDTNGSRPDVVEELINKNLVDCVAMDLKASWKNYSRVIHREGFENKCRRSFEIIQRSLVQHIFRTTVFPPVNTEEDLNEIRSQLLQPGKYVLQKLQDSDKFIEKPKSPPLVTVTAGS